MTRKTASFRVIGVAPAPQGSKRHVGNGRFIEASKKIGPWRKAVVQAVEQMFEQTGDRTTFTQAVKVTATFILPRPSSVPEAKRLWPIVPPDGDKLARGLGDPISLPDYVQLIEDDSLIVEWEIRKIYGTPETMGVICHVQLADDTRAK